MLIAQVTDVHLGFDPDNPAEFNRNYPAEHTVQADAKDFLQKLIPVLRARLKSPRPSREREIVAIRQDAWKELRQRVHMPCLSRLDEVRIVLC